MVAILMFICKAVILAAVFTMFIVLSMFAYGTIKIASAILVILACIVLTIALLDIALYLEME